MMSFKRGDKVVYRMSKGSLHPGPRAINVFPATQGDVYTYEVEKYWTVLQTQPDGMILVVTRRGKQHIVDPADERLRPARFWERLFLRRRFPRLGDEPAPALSNIARSA